jgi:hypothetical protein
LPPLVAVLAAVGALAEGQLLKAQQVAQHSDSLLLDMAAAIVRGGPAANRLWRAPWYADEFVIMSPDGRAVVVLPDLPPVELGLPLAERVIGDSFPTVYLFPPVPGLPIRHGTQMFANRFILAWPQYDSIFGVRDPLFATVMVMYHEIFHVYQMRARWVVAGGSEPPTEIVNSREFQLLAARERTLLVQALETSDADSLKAILRSYLEVRVQRMSLLPVETRSTESTHESMEGTANFVAYQAALRALGGNEADLVKILKEDLVHTPPFDDPTRDVGSYRHWHVYATGAALAFLVDGLSSRSAWQAALEDGRTYQQLIGAAVR